MAQLIIILIAGLTILWIAGKLSGGRALSAATVRQAAGGGLIFLGGFLALRGGIAAAAPFLALGLGMLGKNLPLGEIFGFGRKTQGQKSRVKTRMLAMELDHDTGYDGRQSARGRVPRQAVVRTQPGIIAAAAPGLPGSSRSERGTSRGLSRPHDGGLAGGRGTEAAGPARHRPAR